jgi:SWI/SNF-related matrix-associated actin-dependent regulator 1 of chromatin subfamily A
VTGIGARRKVFMSGTPIVNRPAELFTLLNALDPARWGNWWKYAHRYCAAVSTRFGLDASGASNLDELHHALRSTIMVRRLKKDVLTDLPAKRRQVIELPANGSAGLVNEEREMHERHEDALIQLKARVEAARLADNANEYAELAQELKKAYHVAFEDMSRIRHQVAMAKLPLVVEHVTELLEEAGKVVVFIHHHDVAAGLKAAFGDSCVTITGETPPATRQGLVDRFNTDSTVKVCVMSIRAAGVGLSVKASLEVFAELDWVPGIVSQAEDRCHGIGRGIAGEPLLVQHLVLEGSLDAKMVAFIVRKQAIADQALDNGWTAAQGSEPVLTVEIGSVVDPRTPEGAVTATAAKVVPVASEALRAHVHDGLRMLAGCDQDHAAEINGVGFNKFDGAFGHALAERAKLTDKMVWAGVKLVTKYRGQLGGDYTETLTSLRGVR